MIDSSRYRALYISQITSEFMGIMFMNANDLMEDQVMTQLMKDNNFQKLTINSSLENVMPMELSIDEIGMSQTSGNRDFHIKFIIIQNHLENKKKHAKVDNL